MYVCMWMYLCIYAIYVSIMNKIYVYVYLIHSNVYVTSRCLKRTEDTASDASQIKFMRILKPMRWFKIARLLKVDRLHMNIFSTLGCVGRFFMI